MIIHYTIKVTGRVQGVFYRASAQQKAEELGLRGFAQNQDDGSVFIEAEGDESILNEFVAWCKQGPPLANVNDVQIQKGESKNYREFSVRR